MADYANSLAFDPPRRAAVQAAPLSGALRALADVDHAAWQHLARDAVEPNGYLLPDWMRALDASSYGRANNQALEARAADGSALAALLPVISMWRAYRIPLPALVSADPYGSLSTPLLARDHAVSAFADIMDQARRAGAHALVLRDVADGGTAFAAISDAAARQGIAIRHVCSHRRAFLDATRDADAVLRDALGAKKLKELRRQRNRLAEHGAVTFEMVDAPAAVADALEQFLVLEASGWKAARGTALAQREGDAAFIRRAMPALAAQGQGGIAMLRAGGQAVAAAIVLRHQSRAFYFKIGVDERFAKMSPGVQLTLDLTRYACADPAITMVDSTAAPNHPMIDPIWRGRLSIADIVVPLRPRDPVAALVHRALVARDRSRSQLRRAVHYLRSLQKDVP